MESNNKIISNEMAQVFNTITRQHPSKIALKYLNKEIKSPLGLQRGHLRNE